MDEQARKRKLSEMDDSDVEGVEKEQPKQGLKVANNNKKKQKLDNTTSASASKRDSSTQPPDDTSDAAKRAKLERKKARQERKKDRLATNTEKQKIKQGKKADQEEGLEKGEDDIAVEGMEKEVGEDHADVPANGDDRAADVMETLEVDGIVDDESKMNPPRSTASPSPLNSPIFDNPTPTAQSATTSTSSTIPPATAPKHIKMPTDPELLKARLAARIETLRAARKADGLDGRPARNRQELMDARRKKEEQRRAHKKELRMKAKAEEEARREEALASARDSPASSMMSPALHTASENNFSFGRVTFADGQIATADLSSLRNAPKGKGPQDPATALNAAERKRLRLAALDEEKRVDIEEKDLWLNAKKRAHGERVRDDTSLLKKALKRKEKAKRKSEKEWNTRTEGIAKAQAIKQKKREENLRKRKEEKGGKGKAKGGRVAGSKNKQKVRSRPGFEGSFTSKRR